MEQHDVDALKNDRDLRVKKLYNSNRSAFLSFVKVYNISNEDAIDIYHETFIILRKQAISGKLCEVKCSLKTYLFGIGKHLVHKKLKEYAALKNYNAHLHSKNEDYEEITVEPDLELSREQLLLQKYFNQLGKSCQEMLTLSYYRGLTNEEIAKFAGYENEAVVRSHKSRCLKTLKNLIKNSGLNAE
ncbi:MAG: RNA polymerase sigma factor [Draconibacterium sp.]